MKRMRLFDVIIKGIVMYGIEICGWRIQREIEKIEEKYIKWVLELKREMPANVLMLDTEREALECTAGKTIVRWEKIGKKEESLEKMCWERRRKKDTKDRKEIEMKKKFMERIGWSRRKWSRKIKEEESECDVEVERKMKDIKR